MLRVRIVRGVVEGGIGLFLEVWNGVISDTMASPSTLLLVGHVLSGIVYGGREARRVCCFLLRDTLKKGTTQIWIQIKVKIINRSDQLEYNPYKLYVGLR